VKERFKEIAQKGSLNGRGSHRGEKDPGGSFMGNATDQGHGKRNRSKTSQDMLLKK